MCIIVTDFCVLLLLILVHCCYCFLCTQFTIFCALVVSVYTTHLKRNIISDVRDGDKGEVAEDLRQVFRTGDRNYTVEQAWDEWQRFYAKWGKYYRNIRKRGEDASYKAYFTYLNYDHGIQSMIYTTNWIERLQKDFRRVTRMRGAMPADEVTDKLIYLQN